MNSGELKERTKRLAVRVIEFSGQLPFDDASRIIRKQLIRSATSVAANYRAACRARSRSDFINKLGIVEEEADETVFWLEMLEETRKASSESLMPLKREFQELTAIFTASRKTAKSNRSAQS